MDTGAAFAGRSAAGSGAAASAAGSWAGSGAGVSEGVVGRVGFEDVVGRDGFAGGGFTSFREAVLAFRVEARTTLVTFIGCLPADIHS